MKRAYFEPTACEHVFLGGRSPLATPKTTPLVGDVTKRKAWCTHTVVTISQDKLPGGPDVVVLPLHIGHCAVDVAYGLVQYAQHRPWMRSLPSLIGVHDLAHNFQFAPHSHHDPPAVGKRVSLGGNGMRVRETAFLGVDVESADVGLNDLLGRKQVLLQLLPPVPRIALGHHQAL